MNNTLEMLVDLFTVCVLGGSAVGFTFGNLAGYYDTLKSVKEHAEANGKDSARILATDNLLKIMNRNWAYRKLVRKGITKAYEKFLSEA